MSFSEFLRKNLISFFIIVTCVCIVIGILGLIYEPHRLFGYEAYFSPIIFGIIGVLPSFATYSRKELTIKQMKIRKVIQLIILELMILSFGYYMGIMKYNMMISVALTVLIVYLFVYFITWIADNKKAGELNQELKAFQEKYKQ